MSSCISLAALDRKLQQDDDWLKSLEDNLKKSSAIRNQIIEILDNFETRLNRLEESIVPLYNRTACLQTKQTNISKLMKTIDATLLFYVKASELESSIREGNPSIGLAHYIEKMEQMAEAISFFSSHPTYRYQLDNMRLAFESGCCALEKEFRNIVISDSVIADTTLIIESLDSDYEVISTRLQSITTIRDTQRIREIVKWLLVRDKNRSFLEIYSSIRSDNILKTLATISQHDAASKQKSLLIPSNKSSTISLKQALLKAARRPSERFGSVRDWRATDATVDGILLLLGSFLALIEIETDVLGRVIQDVSVEAYVQRNLFARPFRYVMERALQSLEIADSSLIAFLPLLKHINVHYNQLISLANNAIGEVPYQLFVSKVRGKCISCLNEFLDRLTNDSNKFVPADGNVHQVTSNTLNFLSSLVEHRHTVTQLLALNAPPNSNSSNHLPRLFARVLSALGVNLRNKAENYNDLILASIFLLNNINHIHNVLQQDGMFSIVCEHNSEVRSYYRSEIASLIGKYLESWDRVVSILSFDGNTSNDRQTLKSLLVAFNTEFDKTVLIQKNYCIADLNLCRRIRDEVKASVLKAYEKFYARCVHASFAKTLEKNFKYTVESLEVVIDRLFYVAT